MSRFLFMGEQEDPEMDTHVNRGAVRVYDGTGLERCPHGFPVDGNASDEDQHRDEYGSDPRTCAAREKAAP